MLEGSKSEIVVIKVTETTFLNHYLNLRTRGAATQTECNVLSKILKEGCLKRDNRALVRKATGLGVYSFNNTVNALKKKSLLDYSKTKRTYTPKFPYPENLESLVFRFEFCK